MKWGLTCLLWCLATWSNPLAAQEVEGGEKAALEWRVRSQFAGYQGLVSVGGGPLLAKGVWRPALMYGFAPRVEARSAVHQIILRN